MLHKIGFHFLNLTAIAARANQLVLRFTGAMPVTLSLHHLGMVSNNFFYLVTALNLIPTKEWRLPESSGRDLYGRSSFPATILKKTITDNY